MEAQGYVLFNKVHVDFAKLSYHHHRISYGVLLEVHGAE